MSQPQNDQSTYTISDLAGRFGVSTRTIRFYEEKGLLAPARTTGNQRVYSDRDRRRLRLILRGKRFGFSLEEIAEMIGFSDAEPDEIDQIDKSLAYGEKKLADVRRRREELRRLEEDILAVQEKLMKRKQRLQKERGKP